LKYDNSVHALQVMLRSSNRDEENRCARITKFSSMIHTSREGLDYYYVGVTGKNGCRYLIQAYGEEAIGLQKETKSQNGRNVSL
jgi:hypothetical protein